MQRETAPIPNGLTALMQALPPSWLQRYIECNKATSLTQKVQAAVFMNIGSILAPGTGFTSDKDGLLRVIVLAGGTKKRQDADIVSAKEYWQDYKR